MPETKKRAAKWHGDLLALAARLVRREITPSDVPSDHGLRRLPRAIVRALRSSSESSCQLGMAVKAAADTALADYAALMDAAQAVVEAETPQERSNAVDDLHAEAKALWIRERCPDDHYSGLSAGKCARCKSDLEQLHAALVRAERAGLMRAAGMARQANPGELVNCVCGSPLAEGVRHRADGPCEHAVSPAASAQPAPGGEAVTWRLERKEKNETVSLLVDGLAICVYWDKGDLGKTLAALIPPGETSVTLHVTRAKG